MSTVNKFIAVALLFTADSCNYWLTGRLTVNRCVISFLHSPVLLYAILAFHCVSPISPMQCFYRLEVCGFHNIVSASVSGF